MASFDRLRIFRCRLKPSNAFKQTIHNDAPRMKKAGGIEREAKAGRRRKEGDDDEQGKGSGFFDVSMRSTGYS